MDTKESEDNKTPMSEEELMNIISPDVDPNDTREKITEEDNQDLIKSWYAEAKEMDIQNLSGFINKLNSYNHDYGTVVHATAAASYATAQAMAGFHGITGFQAGCVTRLFLQHWTFNNNIQVGFQVLNLDDMLYPQYKDRFSKTLPTHVAEALKKAAENNLNNRTDAHPDVIKHWKKLSEGVLPFGYKIAED